jgi:hypothetical protein
MKTTLRSKDDLYRAAKTRAALEGVTITKFIGDALEAKFHRVGNQPRHSVQLPNFDGGGFPHSPEKLKRLIQDSQMEHDLKNLGIVNKTALAGETMKAMRLL